MSENLKTKLKGDALNVAAIRSLVIDIINKANSGHPGMALDIAPALYVLFKNHLVSDPNHPEWINRDRFILSSGHNSALLYAMLHCCGYALSMDDLKQFRQYLSLTPGHPEVKWTPGVDATSGPLGQGIAQSIGFAIAEKAIQSHYPEGKNIMNHYTYVLCGDGCLEEGVSQEAISLAGQYELNKLILIYDANGSTLDGPTSNSFSENVKQRFLATNWNAIEVTDGNDLNSLDNAISEAKKSAQKPTVIIVNTKIGYGSPLEGSSKCHGAPLGKENGEKAKENYGYFEEEFFVPNSTYLDLANTFKARGAKAYQNYSDTLKTYSKNHPNEFQLFQDSFQNKLDEKYIPECPQFPADFKKASRESNGEFLQKFYALCPFSFGGSADVAGSTKTNIAGDPDFSKEHPEGRDANWGIREFAMASAQNGILLHGGLKTYIGSFFVFSDYMKSAIRMSALEKVPAIYLFSHDSVAVGEDGPTHEPIEHLAALRAMPNVSTIRPADAKETYAAWKIALESVDHPTAIILSRQGLRILDSSNYENVSKGAYIAYCPKQKATHQIIATGSEVNLAIEVAKSLEGIASIEVVSMPSFDLFEKQGEEYRDTILHLPYEKRISMEMASTFGWGKYAKYNIGIDEYGLSAPEKQVEAHFGFSLEKMNEKVKALLK